MSPRHDTSGASSRRAGGTGGRGSCGCAVRALRRCIHNAHLLHSRQQGIHQGQRAASYTPIQYGDVLFAASGETIRRLASRRSTSCRPQQFAAATSSSCGPLSLVHAPFLGYAMDCRPATDQKATMEGARPLSTSILMSCEACSCRSRRPTNKRPSCGFWTRRTGGSTAIRAKRKVIALLNEQKQAIIHRAVTRGLDPNVPLKPSGIPWLGDIPQHWEVRRLKFVASRIVDYLHATPNYSDPGCFPPSAPLIFRRDRAYLEGKEDFGDRLHALDSTDGAGRRGYSLFSRGRALWYCCMRAGRREALHLPAHDGFQDRGRPLRRLRDESAQ